MDTIKFKKSNLANYQVITEPGLYLLESLSNVTESNLVSDEGENPRYIANFKAIAADKVAQLKQVFAGKEEVSIEETNGLFLTANIWKREGKNASLPMKGEKVECIVDFVPSREGDAQVLRIKETKRQGAKIASTVDLASFEETASAPVAAKTLAHA